MFETLLNPIFSPLLNMPVWLSILIISFIISLIITVVYKYMTDQTMMKDIKHRQKDLQKRMKESKKDPDKLMKMQKEAMELNMKYMSQSFKPTLITFIPIILIFGWLNTNMAFEPIHPGQEFTATLLFNIGVEGEVETSVPDGVTVMSEKKKEIRNQTAEFTLKGEEGNYLLVFEHNGKSYDKELTITNERMYAPVKKIFKKEALNSITLSNEKLIAINLFGNEEGGWSKGRVGWLGTYIIFSLIFSLVLRKLLKIY